VQQVVLEGFCPLLDTTIQEMYLFLQYTDQEMIPARNARNVVTLAEVMFITIQHENILPSKITD
jgi:hypothetical protein